MGRMNKGALVTGSAAGIGRATVLELARAGLDVVVHYRSSRDEAEAVAEQARGFGVQAHVLRADVTVREEAESLIDRAWEATGGLKVLVNNVGNYHHGPMDETTPEQWHEMFDSNLHCTFYACRHVVPRMRQAGGGRIVNLGFAGSETMSPRTRVAAYDIAKTAVIQYSKALAKTEGKFGITVNVVSPGVVENTVDDLPLEQIPLGRYARVDEVATAIRFLVSDEASYMTGVTLEVAGGWAL